ncbi:hypothetical protein GDO81_025083 [Engystomops pustulosus]|uniref:Uncharacterized protein n=1 Tax=Engystomops pustulosus TaxID=76066 RepID=A0AAV6ZRA1_ENGPU|nr:hypothetical protein GDO81_025083 [Engystomops pustulosus]
MCNPLFTRLIQGLYLESLLFGSQLFIGDCRFPTHYLLLQITFSRSFDATFPLTYIFSFYQFSRKKAGVTYEFLNV